MMNRNPTRRLLWLATMLSFWLSVGCDSGTSKPPIAETAIEIIDPVSHPNAGAPVGVVYFRIRNSAPSADRLIRIETPAAANAELHETVANGDLVRMVHHPDGFEIAASDELLLKSGGKHVMLTGLVNPLKDGNSIELDVIFERAGHVKVVVPIRSRSF